MNRQSLRVLSSVVLTTPKWGCAHGDSSVIIDNPEASDDDIRSSVSRSRHIPKHIAHVMGLGAP